MKAGLRFGLDVLLEDPSTLAGKRIGLLANAASVTSRLTPVLPALRRAGADVRVVFGPEHGFTGAAEDMEAVIEHAPSHVRVVSLYGTTFEEVSPRPEQLDGLDAVVSDLPDVGSRYYTFVWTTALMMKACASRGLPVFVLDRPNPLGGFTLEGNLPDEDRLLSFVGLYPLPVRHGMTPGEIARWANEEFRLGCELHVVPMKTGTLPAGRERIDGNESAWVLPSPNMPTRDTTLVYPGACLVEGTNLSEGRGTTRPFELIGAPWLDADEAAAAANGLTLPGVVFRPHVFKPAFQKHAGRLCGGVQLHVTDAGSFRPYETGLRLVKTLRDLNPSEFRWRTEAYEYRDDVPAVDLLAGTLRYRELVDSGGPLDEWIGTFEADVSRFALVRDRHLLYRGGAARTILVVGAHESGKTTLAVTLIGALVKEGYRVASLKHTDHEYDTDLPGKDSHRHAAAGADPALLVAGHRVASHRRQVRTPSLERLLATELRGADVAVVEGFRSAPFPKIEVVRAATGREPVSADDARVIAVVTDRETTHAASIPRFGLDAPDGLLALVKRTLGLPR